MLAAGTVGALVLSVGGLAGTASAQTVADDIAIALNNLPAAIDGLTTGIQTAIDNSTATTPPSIEVLSSGVVDAIANSLVTLGTGTSQLGALGLGVALGVFGAHQGLLPIIQALDDPSLAGGLVTADTIEMIISNLPETFQVIGNNLTVALTEGANGNLVAPGFLDPASGTPALLGNTLAAVGGGLFFTGPVGELFEDTSLSGLGGTVGITTLVVGAVIGSFAGDALQQLEDALIPILNP